MPAAVDGRTNESPVRVLKRLHFISHLSGNDVGTRGGYRRRFSSFGSAKSSINCKYVKYRYALLCELHIYGYIFVISINVQLIASERGKINKKVQ